MVHFRHICQKVPRLGEKSKVFLKLRWTFRLKILVLLSFRDASKFCGDGELGLHRMYLTFIQGWGAYNINFTFNRPYCLQVLQIQVALGPGILKKDKTFLLVSTNLSLFWLSIILCIFFPPAIFYFLIGKLCNQIC